MLDKLSPIRQPSVIMPRATAEVVSQNVAAVNANQIQDEIAFKQPAEKSVEVQTLSPSDKVSINSHQYR